MPTKGTPARRERQARSVSVRRRALPIEAEGERCVAPNCHAPTMAAAGKGFSRMHCPAHFDRFNRHGSFWLGAIPGGLLAPLRRAAERWIEKECLAGIELAGIAALMNTAGVDPLNTYSLRGLDTRQKALNTLAHLHRLGVPPSRILAPLLASPAALPQTWRGAGAAPTRWRTCCRR